MLRHLLDFHFALFLVTTELSCSKCYQTGPFPYLHSHGKIRWRAGMVADPSFVPYKMPLLFHFCISGSFISDISWGASSTADSSDLVTTHWPLELSVRDKEGVWDLESVAWLRPSGSGEWYIWHSLTVRRPNSQHYILWLRGQSKYHPATAAKYR